MITESNKEGILLYGLCTAAMGFTVLHAALVGGVPMPEESHGGAIYEVPATIWAYAVIIQGLGLMIGAAIQNKVMLLVFGLFAAVTNIYLAIFADDAIFGFLVARGAGVFGVLHIGIATAAAMDLIVEALLRIGARHDDGKP